jgi:hypothetical protein
MRTDTLRMSKKSSDAVCQYQQTLHQVEKMWWSLSSSSHSSSTSEHPIVFS